MNPLEGIESFIFFPNGGLNVLGVKVFNHCQPTVIIVG